MGSGAYRSEFGKYVGNNNAAAREFKHGFKPKCVKIRSVVGEVVFHEGMPAAWKQLDSAVPAFLAAGAVEFMELGFKIVSTDTGVNGAATDYYYEAY